MSGCYLCWPFVYLWEMRSLRKATAQNCEKYVPKIRRAKVVSVYDGDTITVAAKSSCTAPPLLYKVRLARIDTPELRTKDAEEKRLAILARDALSEKILGKIVTLENVGLEKYGRVLADISYRGENICDWLLKEKYAKPYDGGTKDTDWGSAVKIQIHSPKKKAAKSKAKAKPKSAPTNNFRSPF